MDRSGSITRYFDSKNNLKAKNVHNMGTMSTNHGRLSLLCDMGNKEAVSAVKAGQDAVSTTPPMRNLLNASKNAIQTVAPSTGASDSTCQPLGNRCFAPSPFVVDSKSERTILTYDPEPDGVPKEGSWQPVTLPSCKRLQLQKKLQTECASEQQLKEVESRFQWLKGAPDARGRSVKDAAHDKRTVQLPRDVWNKLSPSQRQYWETKSQYMDVLLFFKVGTFYELYEDDAQAAHDVLDWKLTVTGVGHCRQVGCPERGLPDAIRALNNAGYKVGIMEQLETAHEAKKRDPKKGIIQRQLTQISTPATDLAPACADAVHLLALYASDASDTSCSSISYAILDAAGASLSFGQVAEKDTSSSIRSLLALVCPSEILYCPAAFPSAMLRLLHDPAFGARLTPLPQSDVPAPAAAAAVLQREEGGARVLAALESAAREGEDIGAIASASAALLAHIKRMRLSSQLLPALQVKPFTQDKSLLLIDGASMEHLEVLRDSAGSSQASLFRTLDSCGSHNGKRLLRSWLCRPLTDVRCIRLRQAAVRQFMAMPGLLEPLEAAMRASPDLERALGRARTAIGAPPEVLPFKVRAAAQQKRLMATRSAVHALYSYIRALGSIKDAISSTAPSEVQPHGLLGSMLSGLPASNTSALQLLGTLQDAVVEVSELKKVKGGRSPAQLQLCERVFEDLQGCAPEVRLSQEIGLTTEILEALAEHEAVWDAVCVAGATLDVLAALARFGTGAGGPVCLPTFVDAPDAPVFEARELWHPALALCTSSPIVPNDVCLGSPHAAHSPRTLLLTGPNMGGKSTLLRTCCTAVMLAQMGSPVPSRQLTLSAADAIFTRIGATDRIITGESTFLVEASECAAILRKATRRSLVVFDELGRGTSTFDGYAIAFSVLEHMVEQVGCRQLFATHYHALNDEFAGHRGIRQAHMAAMVRGQGIVFEYKLRAGSCPKSYGLQVAKLAGIPDSICKLAEEQGSAMESSMSRYFRTARKRARACRESPDRPDGAEDTGGSDEDWAIDDGALLQPLVLDAFKASHAAPVSCKALCVRTRRAMPALGF